MHGRTRVLGVIERDVGDHRNVGIDDVGRIPAAEHSNFDHGNVNWSVGKTTQRSGGENFKK